MFCPERPRSFLALLKPIYNHLLILNTQEKRWKTKTKVNQNKTSSITSVWGGVDPSFYFSSTPITCRTTFLCTAVDKYRLIKNVWIAYVDKYNQIRNVWIDFALLPDLNWGHKYQLPSEVSDIKNMFKRNIGDFRGI